MENDTFILHQFWFFLRDTFGFDTATAIVYIGFFISLVLFVFWTKRVFINYYRGN